MCDFLNHVRRMYFDNHQLCYFNDGVDGKPRLLYRLGSGTRHSAPSLKIWAVIPYHNQIVSLTILQTVPEYYCDCTHTETIPLHSRGERSLPAGSDSGWISESIECRHRDSDKVSFSIICHQSSI